jgi:sulfur carrier protein
MKIKANGKDVTLEKEVNIKELLTLLKVEMPEFVTVQVNEDIIDSEDFNKTITKEGDNIEFIYFMGGGQ